MELADLLLSCGFDPDRGVYVPLGSHPFLRGKLTEDFASLPKELKADEGTPLCFFGNPLVFPENFGTPEFNIAAADKPSLRATNAGFLVVTVEHDCENRVHFEQICSWLSKNGPFEDLDHELRQYRDYDGYCVVFTGNRSLHFHLVFNTRHLTEAPYNQPALERWQCREIHAAIMTNVHQVYWNAVVEMMDRILAPPISADRSGNSYTQWKRMPWGIRKLEKYSEILALSPGTLVPQLVLAETIRTKRSSRGSNKFIVAADFSTSHYLQSRKRTFVEGSGELSAGEDMVNELACMCRLEWRSEFPKPVHMKKDRGEWTIHFQNNPTDRNPSTVAKGHHTTLLLQGHSAPSGTFSLPGELSANEIGDHLAGRFGIIDNSLNPQQPTQIDLPLFERLKAQAGKSFKETYEDSTSRSFPHISSSPVPELLSIYRKKLWRYFHHALSFHGDMICVSGEGIGKTWALFDLMQHQALDTAIHNKDSKIKFLGLLFEAERRPKRRQENMPTKTDDHSC